MEPSNKRSKKAARDAKASLESMLNQLAASLLPSEFSHLVGSIGQHLEDEQRAFIARPSECAEHKADTSLYSCSPLEASACLDLCYTVRRLIRGSATANERTRISYCAALSTFSARFDRLLPLPVLWDWINVLLRPDVVYGSSSISKSEQSSIDAAYIGCIHALLARAKDVAGAPVDLSDSIATRLLGVANSKSFLRPGAFEALLLLLKLRHNSPAVFGQDSVSIKLDADGLYFLVRLEEQSASLLSHFDTASLQTPILENTEMIMASLVESISTVTEAHPLWRRLLEKFASEGHLKDAWPRIEAILCSSDSIKKQCLALDLFAFLCSTYPVIIDAPGVTNILQRIGPHLGSKGKRELPLNAAVERLLGILLQRPQILQHMAGLLGGSPGFPRFPPWFLAQFFHALDADFLTAQLEDEMQRLRSGVNEDRLSQRQGLDYLMACFNSRVLFEDRYGQARNVLLHFLLEFHLIGDKSAFPGQNSPLQSVFVTYAKHVGCRELLRSLVKWLKDHEVQLRSTDAIVAKATRKCCRLLKTVARCRKGKSDNVLLLTGMQVYLQLAYVWLQFEPELIADSFADLKELVSSVGHPKASSSKLSPLAAFLDHVLRLLSANSLFVRIVCEEVVKIVAPLLDFEALELFSAVLKARQNGADEEVMEDMETFSDSSDQDGELSLVTGDFTLPAPVSNGSDSEPDVNLDDADPEELAAFDSKLSEIFRLKRQEARKGQELKRQTVEFKHKVASLVKILYPLNHSQSLPLDQQLVFLGDLLEAAELNMREESSKKVAQSLAVHIKHWCSRLVPGQGSAVIKLDEGSSTGPLGASWTSVVSQLTQRLWQNPTLFDLGLNILKAMFICLPEADRQDRLASALVLFWQTGVSSKKLQKSKFFGFLNFWVDRAECACLKLCLRTGFLGELDQLGAFSKGQALSSIGRLLKRPLEDGSESVRIFLKSLCNYYSEKYSEKCAPPDLAPIGLKAVKEELDLVVISMMTSKRLGCSNDDFFALLAKLRTMVDHNGKSFIDSAYEKLARSV